MGKAERPRRLFYGSLVGLVLVLLGADLRYFQGSVRSEPTPPAAVLNSSASAPVLPAGREAACGYRPGHPPVEDFGAMVDPADPIVGADSASVTVIEFFDPNCPHCKTLHPVMKAVVASHADVARFVYKPIPGWDYSVVQVAALLDASRQGKYAEMQERQFALQQPRGLSAERLKSLAEEIGMDADAMMQRISANEYRDVMQRSLEHARAAGLTGVPSVLINGRLVALDSHTEECLGVLIDAAARADTAAGQ